MFYAHSKRQPDGKPAPVCEWEPLFTPFGGDIHDHCQGETCQQCENLKVQHGHLNKVAWWSAKFTEDMFNKGLVRDAITQWGRLSGLWHDLGKYSIEFRDYIAHSNGGSHEGEMTGRVDHSTAGAQHVAERNPMIGRLLSYLIAGHHAGLADGIAATKGSLENRLKKSIPEYQENAPMLLLDVNATLPPVSFFTEGCSISFALRMLFSALVDADFLATESFMSADKSNARKRELPEIGSLEDCLNTYILSLPTDTFVNKIRSKVHADCLNAADNPPGMFSLTVPTGGGKTFSSLAFALKHARLHNLRRVIYVIPYTSIIEQNAGEFREALAEFGPDVVLEHHSNLDADEKNQSTWSRLAAENWDARIIVTTNVQFYESLYSNRPSRCRKLHRIARSVVILDEAQSLPVEYLDPCLRALEQLVENYGSSVVLCTATQPAIVRNHEFKLGIKKPLEIIPEPGSLYQSLKRVECVHMEGTLDNDSLNEELIRHDQVLCIVNTRRHARQLFDLLPDDGCRFHLSALMCPQHRTKKLVEIRTRLEEGKPIRLISTQLIEAGVNIDFPVVYRSLAGLDAIAQAAGRCDREGNLTATRGVPAGKLFVFSPDFNEPPGHIRSSVASALEVLSQVGNDPLSLDCIEQYFRTHYWKHADITDQNGILDCWPLRLSNQDDLLLFKFKTCAENFRLIDDYSMPVIIPYDNRGEELCDKLKNTYEPREIRSIARKLQRYTVNIPPAQHLGLCSTGVLLSVHSDNFYILGSDPHYSDEYGLHPDPNITLTPEQAVL